MQKVTNKIYGRLNTFPLAAELEPLPAEVEFLVLAFGWPDFLTFVIL